MKELKVIRKGKVKRKKAKTCPIGPVFVKAYRRRAPR